MSIEQTLISRAGKFEGRPRLAPVTAAARQALELSQTLRTRAAEIENDPHRNALGKQDAKRKAVAEYSAAIFRSIRAAEAAKASIQNRTTFLNRPRRADPADHLAAIQDMELRTMLRAVTPVERAQLLLGQDADMRLLKAAVGVPDYLSGINAEMRDHIMKKIVEHEHPGALAAVESDSEAVELLTVASQVLQGTAKTIGEFSDIPATTEFVRKSTPRASDIERNVDANFIALAQVA